LWVFFTAFVVAKKNEGFGSCPMLERKNVGLE